MAITQTRTVQRVEVYQGTQDEKPRLMVVYEHNFDDTEDDQLPVTTTKVVHLNATTHTIGEDDSPVEVATDVSNQDQLVQDICAALWADV